MHIFLQVSHCRIVFFLSEDTTWSEFQMRSWTLNRNSHRSIWRKITTWHIRTTQQRLFLYLPKGQRAEKGRQTDSVYGRICRHMTRGAETSGGGWQVAWVCKVQLDDLPWQDRIWGAGVTEREVIRRWMFDDGRGGSTEEGNLTIQKSGWDRWGSRIKNSINASDRVYDCINPWPRLALHHLIIRSYFP